MMQNKVTKNFCVSEFDCRDGTNYPEVWISSRLKPLCEQLEIIRSHFKNKKITIVSGYRTPLYNLAVSGAKNSQHKYGRAADIKIEGISARAVSKEIRELYRQKKIVIGGLGSYPTFTHVDVRINHNVRLAYWIK